MMKRLVPVIAIAAMAGSTGAHAAWSGVRERFGAPGTPMLVVAHRACHNPAPHHGMPGNAPENSISGIERCIAIGVDIAEVDVRRTKDGYLVLMHDETVDRTTNGQGKVVDLTLAQIRAFVQRQDEGGPEAPLTTSQVPTLDEALAAARGRIMINLDVQAGLYADVIATVHRLGQEDGVIVKEPAGAGSPVLTQIAPFDSVPFMPILEEGGDLAAIAAKQTSGRPPIAMELPRMSADALPALAAITHKTGTRLWINSLWEGFVRGFGGDVAALRAPDMVWGRLQRSGVSVIQTDEPEALLRFLKR